MIRVDDFFSCNKQHKINIKNLVFYKDNTYQTFTKQFNLNGLESTDSINIINNFNILRKKYNTLKLLLNQYKLRHQLLNKSTENKVKFENGIDTLNGIDLSTIENPIMKKIDNGFVSLKKISTDLENFKNNIDASLNNIKNNIPNTIKTNSAKEILLGYIDKNWVPYRDISCYIDIPIDPSKYFLLTILESKSIEEGYKVIGVNSLYPSNGFIRIYLYKISQETALKNNFKIWYLAIKKD